MSSRKSNHHNIKKNGFEENNYSQLLRGCKYKGPERGSLESKNSHFKIQVEMPISKAMELQNPMNLR